MKKPAKLLIGPRVRRLRQSLSLTQAQMAERIDISTSYLNLIESNQRPVSAKILMRLAQNFQIDIADLSPAEDLQMVQAISEMLKTPGLKSVRAGRGEIEDAVNASPDLMRAFIALHERVSELSLQVSANASADPVDSEAGPVESVRRFVQNTQNHFPELDEAAEKLAGEIGPLFGRTHTALTKRLADKHGIRVRIVPPDILPGRYSQFDPHRRLLDLSENLHQSGRRFQMAVRIGREECRGLFSAIIAKAILPTKAADDLARVNLANYFAGALLMPYAPFLEQAEKMAYDIERLSRKFDTSYEQTAHRLTTLQRDGARGVPFFFMRVDRAGNVSKRLSGSGFHFSRFGGACPLWNMHSCFASPGETLPQMIEMPDGTKYLSMVRAVLRPGGAFGEPAQMLAIGLGCAERYADRLVYSRGLTPIPTPIGANCHVCERIDCRARAFPPVGRTLSFDDRSRRARPYQF